MATSADVALLFKISELAIRYGLRPSEADADLRMTMKNSDEYGPFELSFGSSSSRPDKREKFEQMMSALGCKQGALRTDELSEMEDIVDRALSLAPRARSR